MRSCIEITFTVHRKEPDTAIELEVSSEKSSQKGSQKSSQKIIELMQHNQNITIDELALAIGISDRAIKKQIERMKAQQKLKRVGPDKGGHWEVLT